MRMEKQGIKIESPLFVDNLKLLARSKNQIDSLAQTAHIFSEDTRMQFGIKKCTVLREEK